MNFFKVQVSKKGAGFTLVEMIIVVAIFSVIIVATIGVFVSAIRAQRYSLAAQQLLDQTSYVMEYIGRSLRMAKKELDDGTPNCLSSDGLNYEKDAGVYIPEMGRTITVDLLFKDYQKRCKGFFLDGDQLKEYEKGRDPEVLPLTSDKLKVTFFNVNLSGQTQDDTLQPRVTIFLKAEAGYSDPKPEIKLQTTISQRDLDIPE